MKMLWCLYQSLLNARTPEGKSLLGRMVDILAPLRLTAGRMEIVEEWLLKFWDGAISADGALSADGAGERCMMLAVVPVGVARNL
jgi:hypothetical protein